MNAVHCPPPDSLSAYYHGQLSDEESDGYLAHISHCSDCQTILETSGTFDDPLIDGLKCSTSDPSLSQEDGFHEGMLRSLGAYSFGNALANPPDHEVPDRIGEYEIQGWLGQGGMGKVYLANHDKLGRQVALKVLSSHRLADKKARQRFVGEMQAIGRLSHPGIVSAFDAREIDGVDVLVTEYIDGWDLSEVVRKTGPLPIPVACEIARKVAETLQYTSDQGYVHRDVKPSNIMLSRSGDVKLLDLGLAKLQMVDESSPQVTQTGQTMGTADYIAPEQVTESRTVTIAADLYALGATLYKLLTGRPPFPNPAYPSAFSKLNAHVYATPESILNHRPDVPKGLDKLILRLLEKNPSNRPISPSLVAEQLSGFAKQADLRSFAHRLSLFADDYACTRTEQCRTPELSAPASSSRWIPPFVRSNPLLAAGLGGVFGFCFGILLTITNPDGTQTKIELPAGSQIAISDGNAIAAAPPAKGASASEGTTAASSATEIVDDKPLIEFAILMGKEDLLVAPPEGKYVRLSPDVETKYIYVETRDGAKYAAIDTEQGTKISTDQRTGTLIKYIPSADGKSIHLIADEQLGSQLSLLSSANLGKSLGIIIDGEVVAALVVQNQVSSHIALTGQRSFINRMEQLLQSSGVTRGPLDPKKLAGDTNVTSNGPEIVVDRSVENLKRIGVAFHHFLETHGTFPASRTFLIEGRVEKYQSTHRYPVSWRVAILPYIEQIELFNQYNPYEPWDGPTNLRLLDKMPSIYRSPRASANQLKNETNFLGIVDRIRSDKASLGSAEGPTKLVELAAMPLEVDLAALPAVSSIASIRDGTSNTIMILESAQPVPWTKPEDFGYALVSDIRKLRTFQDAPLLVLKADGAVMMLSTPVDEDLFYKLVTKAGGEVINELKSATQRIRNN